MQPVLWSGYVLIIFGGVGVRPYSKWFSVRKNPSQVQAG